MLISTATEASSCSLAIEYLAIQLRNLKTDLIFPPLKVIDWAVACKVDIISMSWTIEGRAEAFQETEDLDGLKAAISTAEMNQILMFCAASDQSSNKPETNGVNGKAVAKPTPDGVVYRGEDGSPTRTLPAEELTGWKLGLL